QMAQIGARMVPARVTAAALVERPIVFRVAGVLDVETPLAREKLAVAGVPRGQHAVEHVDAACDALDEIPGRAGAHQIPRPILRQSPSRVAHDGIHHVDGLANAEAANRIPLEVNRNGRVGTLVPQALENASLDDTELGLTAVGRDRAR